jgi:hypothetical protein
VWLSVLGDHAPSRDYHAHEVACRPASVSISLQNNSLTCSSAPGTVCRMLRGRRY